MKPVAIITGGAGFIGHYLVNEFSHTHDLICLVRPGSGDMPRIIDIAKINNKWYQKDSIWINEIDINNSRATFVSHDLKNPALKMLEDNFDLSNVDLILHAGGNPSSESSINNPSAIVYDNVVGTVNMLEVAKSIQPKRFVYYGAAESYGPVEEGSASIETDPYNSVSPYAASKSSGAEFCVAYSKTFGVPVSIINIANTFGQRCQTNRYPVVVIKNILNRQETSILKSGDGKVGGRRWFHAQDVADITRFVIEHQIPLCDKWNAAGEYFVDNVSFGKLVSNILELPFNYKYGEITRLGHSSFMSISPQKIYNAGWSPKFSFIERLKETVIWYKNNIKWL